MDLTASNFTSPLAFKDWKQTTTFNTNEEAFASYNTYLRNWYTNNGTLNSASNINNLRLNYLELLEKLQIFFSSTELESWYSSIDLNNKTELLLSIPYFSKKLKEIALYFLKQRDEIKKVRSKSELAGTNLGLEKLLYNYILTAFSKKNYSIGLAGTRFYNDLPELKDIANNLRIDVEELYDIGNYYDQSPEVPLTNYYNLTSTSVTQFLTANNFNIDEIDWLYSTGIPSLTGNQNQYLNFEQREKYLGNNLNILQLIKTVASNVNVSQNILNLSTGSNLFYWTSSLDNKINNTEVFNLPININNSDFKYVQTSETEFPNADKIYKITKTGIQGAWLQNADKKKINTFMMTNLPVGKAADFRFPYPGYGLQGEGLPWTGPSLTDNNVLLFNTLDKPTKQDILNKYWSYTPEITSFDPLYLQEINLPNANASTNFLSADKLILTLSGNNTKESYWLYAPYKTDISIAEGDNKIYWPLTKLTDNTFPVNIGDDYCLPVPLSTLSVSVSTGSIVFSEATPGLVFGEGDTIYKLRNTNDTKELAVEVAWLSGQNMDVYTTGYARKKAYRAARQPGFSVFCSPGRYTPFIWNSTARILTPLSAVFTNVQHSPDCQYLQQNLNPLYTSNLFVPTSADKSQFNKCTCKSIYFSPFGHPGKKYTDYKYGADFIVSDDFYFSFYNANAVFPYGFNIQDWVNTFPALYSLDTVGLSSLSAKFIPFWRQVSASPNNTNTSLYDYMSSTIEFGIKNFAWYQISGTDVGWGPGRWVDFYGNVTTLSLTGGNSYYYYRTNLNRDVNDITNSLPYYVVKAKQTRRAPAVWVKAILSGDNTWHDTQEPTDMVLYPGDILIYDHKNSYNVTSITAGLVPLITATNFSNTIWSTYDYVTPNNQIQISIPSQLPIALPLDTQYGRLTSLVYPSITSVDWKIRVKSSTNDTGYIGTYSFINNNLITNSSGTITGSVNSVPVNLTLTTTNASSPRAAYGTSLLFNPTSAGVYYIFLTAYHDGSIPNLVDFGKIAFDNIVPAITCVPTQRIVTGFINQLYPKANFVLNVPLSGWDIVKKVKGGTGARYAKPYWVKTKNTDGLYLRNNYFEFVDDYNLITQPLPANTYLNTGQEITYINVGLSAIPWIQPITYNLASDNKQWKKIAIQTYGNHPLALTNNYRDYINNTSLTYPLSDASDMMLESYSSGELIQYVYYTPQPDFSITLNLSTANTDYYYASGSITDVMSSTYVQASEPYANLLNRHYPSIASVPNLDTLYSVKDLGGYFTPKNLGVLTYTTNNVRTTPYSISTTTDTITAVFKAENYSLTDRGFTTFDNVSPFFQTFGDSSWLKGSPLLGSTFVYPTISKTYQKFLGYQSKIESTPISKSGLVTPDTKQAPWKGRLNDQWIDTINYPFDFRGVNNVENWKDNQILQYSDLQLYKWSTDIYGNQYGLYKDIANSSIYKQKTIPGSLWIKNTQNDVVPATVALSAVFKNFVNLSFYDTLSSNFINDIEIYHDVLFVRIKDANIFVKINYDFETGQFTAPFGETNFVNYTDESGAIEIEEDYNPTGILLQNIDYPSIPLKEIKFFNPIINIDPNEVFWSFTSDKQVNIQGLQAGTNNSSQVAIEWGDGSIDYINSMQLGNHIYRLPFFAHNATPGTILSGFSIQTTSGENYDVSWGDGTADNNSAPDFKYGHKFIYFSQLKTYGNTNLKKDTKFLLGNSGTLPNIDSLSYDTTFVFNTTSFAITATKNVYDMLALSGTVAYNNPDRDEPTYIISYDPVTNYTIASTRSAILHSFNDYQYVDSWFVPETNKVIVVHTLPTFGNSYIVNITPIIYEFDITNFSYKKLFPLPGSDLSYLSNLANLGISNITSSSFSYNTSNDTVVISVVVDLVPNLLKTYAPYETRLYKTIKSVLINFYVQKTPEFVIKDIEVIIPNENVALLQENSKYILQENYIKDYYESTYNPTGNYFIEVEQ